MRSERAWQLRRLTKSIDDLTFAGGRWLDFAVTLVEVERHPSGSGIRETGRRATYGGCLDRVTRQFCGPATDPVEWYLSSRQWEAVTHACSQTAILLRGGEGSGKTVTLAMWVVLRVIAATGLEVDKPPMRAGVTAPTNERVQLVMDEVRKLMPPSWYELRVSDMELHFANGLELQFRGVKRQSAEVGSRIQGMTWIFCGSDEVQDYRDTIDGDIEARGRGAPEGKYLRLSTATPKDSARWRDQCNKWDASPDWVIMPIRGPENPWIPDAHWERMRRNLSEREAQRRIDGVDGGPELALYPPFDRRLHVAALPPNARDVTAQVLGAAYQSYVKPGGVLQLLVGHDPGVIQNTSVFVRAYLIDRLLTWWVVGECVTKQTTADQHAATLRRVLQQDFDLNWPIDRKDHEAGTERALIVCDPHGRGETKTGYDVYQSFQAHQLDIIAASQRQIAKKQRIEMVCRLLRSAAQTTRLYILTRDGNVNHPVAPELVRSLAEQEKDYYGRLEVVTKDEDDVTHAGCALGYSLWPFERMSTTEFTQRTARAA